MAYSIQCECRRPLSVTASQAATRVPCACGRLIEVPALSRLRQNAGQGAYEAGTIDIIRRMISTGDLPTGQVCALSGDPTSDCYELFVQCESSWMKGPGSGHFAAVILLFLLMPFWFVWMAIGKSMLDEERREVGHNRGVTIPLRICNRCHEKLRRTRSQWKLRRLLRTVPIYAQLLQEFPYARIST